MREWSLNTRKGRGGLQDGRGWGSKVLSLQEWGGGAEKVLAMLMGEHKTFCGSFKTGVMRGGAQRVLDPRFSHFSQ